MNLLFLCLQEGYPRRGEPPFPLRLETPANSFDNRGGRQKGLFCPSKAAPGRAVPTAPAHLQLGAAAKAAAANQTRSLRSSWQPHLDVLASAKPHLRAAAGHRPHDDLIAISQWGAASAGGRIAESRGRGRNPAC